MNKIQDYASEKAKQFTESVIREMSRVAAKHGAINLAQGFPDFPAPEELKQAASEALFNNQNQYAITWGNKDLRDAIAWKIQRDYQVRYDPEEQITVCCGSTEGMIASLLATVNPGDEVIVFEPFYENYGADVILCGALPKYVTLKAPDFHFDYDELAAAFSDKTKAIIINTPNNPTGKVFLQEELEFIAKLCIQYDALAITDEIYEHILYDGARHIPLWEMTGMEKRTIVINSISKTYSLTGWRIGYVLASKEITQSVRKVHDFLTVGAAAPLQAAASRAFHFSEQYYKELAVFYTQRRDYFLSVLQKAGFSCIKPQGAYYIMTGFENFSSADDVSFDRTMAERVGVAVVPGSSFYREGNCEGRSLIRFCFCKQMSTLQAAAERLAKIKYLDFSERL